MDSLLSPVSTAYKTSNEKEEVLTEVVEQKQLGQTSSSKATTPTEALEILKHEPDHETLIQTLRFLKKGLPGFKITSPSPINSQLVHVLVTDILPSYWSVLSSESRKNGKAKQTSELGILVACLRSVTGLKAIVLSLKRNIQIGKASKKSSSASAQSILTTVLQFVEVLLEGSKTVQSIWSSIWGSSNPATQKKALWTECLGLIGGGRLLGMSAEAEDVVNDLSDTVTTRYWVADGNRYGTWLSRNVCHWARNLHPDSENGWRCCGEVLARSLHLGKAGQY